MAITRGDLVQATQASGATITMVAVGAPEQGYRQEMVWLATEQEWERASVAGDDPDAVPWPVSAVAELTNA